MAIQNALTRAQRLPSSGIDHKLNKAYLQRVTGEFRAHHGRSLAAKDPRWDAYAKHYQGVADEAKGRMSGMNSAGSNILDLIQGRGSK